MRIRKPRCPPLSSPPPPLIPPPPAAMTGGPIDITPRSSSPAAHHRQLPHSVSRVDYAEDVFLHHPRPQFTMPTPTAPPLIIPTSQALQQDLLRLEHSNGKSSAVAEYLEHDLGRTRLLADDVVEESSAIDGTESVITRHTSLIRRKGNRSRTTSMEAQDQPNLLAQSLHHVCSIAGNTGLTAREAVARITDQGLPGLNEGGERLIVQVAKLFRSCSDFVQQEERGRYFLRDDLKCRDSSLLIMGDPTRRRKKTVSSVAMIQAARQLQNLQRSQLNLDATGTVDLGKPQPSLEFQDAVSGKVGFGQEASRETSAVTDQKFMAKDHKVNSKGTNSEKASPVDQTQPQCNRDDGKGWRCFRPAEAGFALCKYHRDQIRRAEIRRKNAKSKFGEQFVRADSPSSSYVAMAYEIPTAGNNSGAFSNSDDELPDHKRRRFVKAKSLKSLL